ncbi:ABC transporter substrate-binding protein [Microvirga sp. W0021]|uniref:ABC transporter substrate-binding protein n=1 Tax=Hohaiivirga grylli TaxID=3133970 RepID=A0ABV0BFP9_9HYPH
MSLYRLIQLCFTLLLVGLVYSSAQASEGETAHFPALQTETARLEIHAATDTVAMEPLIRDFQKTAPDIAIDFVEYVTNDLQDKAEITCQNKAVIGDLLISSAIDQLVKLANDGCALAHVSAETKRVEDWANWRNEIYGFTFEPIVFVYNAHLVPPDDVPRTHAALADLLRQRIDYYRGRIGTYDIRVSGVGYQLAFEDTRQPSSIHGRLIESMSRAEVKVHCCTNSSLDEVASGRLYIGYNIIGSYAYAASLKNPDLKVVVPRDYALILSRGALIPKTSKQPALAARFIDYLLSERGQEVARREAFFFHKDANLPEGVDGPKTLEESGISRPIRIGPALLAMQDEAQRRRFIADWSRLMIDIKHPTAAP